MKPKTALVGINGYAQAHLRCLQLLVESAEIELSAAVILPKEQTSENLGYFKSIGCRVFDSVDDMFLHAGKLLDLVCLPVGISSHEPLTKCCLSHGVNVLVEKPAASSIAAVDRMIAAEVQSGCFVAVGYQHIYSRTFQKIKRDLLAGRFGK